MPRDWMPGRYSKGWVYTFALTRLQDLSDEEVAALAPFLDFELNPEAQEPRNETLEAYCLECDALHEELDFLLYEMDLSVQVIHADSLEDRRLGLLYHADNFLLRVYSYREKAFQLVNQALALGIRPKDRRLKENVLAALEAGTAARVGPLLQRLLDEPVVRDIVTRRNDLVHEIAVRDFRTLSTRQRADEAVRELGVVDTLDRLTYLEQLHAKLQEDFGGICAALARFRDDLAAALKETRAGSMS